MNAVLDLTELDHRFGISDVARVSEGHGGLARVEINTPLAHGEIYLHGAHVTSWRPAGSEEVLFLGTKSRWEEGQAIRGGIPICFPWFRKGRRSSRSGAWICAHQIMAALFNRRE